MSCRINEVDGIVMAIRVQIQAQRVIILAPVAVFADETPYIRVVVPRPEIIQARFFVKELARVADAEAVLLQCERHIAPDVVIVAVPDVARIVRGLDHIAVAVIQQDAESTH